MIRLAVLGATGSIGRQTLEVAARERERLQVVALAAGRDRDGLAAAARTWRPRALALEHAADPAAARGALLDACPGAEVWIGPDSAARLVEATACDTVVNGIVGAAGLAASLACLARGARLALANKETLVVGGPLVRAALARGGTLVPVDSEHSAALLCLGGRPSDEVACLTLTASGGPLRGHPDWRRATRSEVLAHPVWAMGPRITTDSALLVNKALELIEACALFGLGWDQVDAVIHPQARVHAMASFTDGAMVVQAAPADMRLPIQLALSWPEHWGAATTPLAPAALAGLTFEPIPSGVHPAYDLGIAAGRAGGTAPCVFNAADEIAVARFLDGVIPLGAVPEMIAAVLERHDPRPVESFEQLRVVDAWARAETERRVAAR
ncbi:MAG: 1-deoxy-D-xylulose-5-phosphate reductoisomerase [Candidatus Eisenbacteria bacterium]